MTPQKAANPGQTNAWRRTGFPACSCPMPKSRKDNTHAKVSHLETTNNQGLVGMSRKGHAYSQSRSPRLVSFPDHGTWRVQGRSGVKNGTRPTHVGLRKWSNPQAVSGPEAKKPAKQGGETGSALEQRTPRTAALGILRSGNHRTRDFGRVRNRTPVPQPTPTGGPTDFRIEGARGQRPGEANCWQPGTRRTPRRMPWPQIFLRFVLTESGGPQNGSKQKALVDVPNRGNPP